MKNPKYILLGVFCVVLILIGYFFLPKNWDVWVISNLLPNKNRIEETVQGTSMEPLIQDGQKVEYLSGYYMDHTVERSDVIIAEVAAHSGLIIKRVVGIPWDVWTYSGWIITLKGDTLKNSAGHPYVINSPMLKLYSESYPTIPKDSFLILWDQVGGTLDASKFWFISLGEILGKVVNY